MPATEDHLTLRHELHHAIIKTFGLICRRHMKTNTNVASVEGLVGITITDGHTFLYNLKEINPKALERELKISEIKTEVVADTHTESWESTQGKKAAGCVQVSCTGTAMVQEFDTSRDDEDIGEIVAKKLDNTNGDDAQKVTVKRGSADVAEESKKKSERDTAIPEKRRKLNDSPISQPTPSTSKDIPDPPATITCPDESSDLEEHYDDPILLDDAELTIDNKPIDFAGILVDTPFGQQCTLCGQNFSSQNSSRRHVKFKHFRVGSSCPFCQRLFRNNNELGDHIIGEHSGHSTPYTCGECNNGFKSRHTLRSHIETVHRGKRRFRCHLCDEGFHTSKACHSHLATKHPHCDECGMSVFSLDGHTCGAPSGYSAAALGVKMGGGSTPLGSPSMGGAALGGLALGGAALGIPGPNSFRLNKKALGDIAKSVIAQVVGDSDGSMADTDVIEDTGFNNNQPRGGPILEPGEIRRPIGGAGFIQNRPIFMHGATANPIRISPPRQSVASSSLVINSPGSISRQPSAGHTAASNSPIPTANKQLSVQDDNDNMEVSDHRGGGRQTPSPTASELSDCTITYICETCGVDFDSQEEYHGHIIRHPWCKSCDERVLNIRDHRKMCPARQRHNMMAQRYSSVSNDDVISLDD